MNYKFNAQEIHSINKMTKEMVNEKDDDGKTILMIAASLGYEEIVEWLIVEMGANPYLKDEENGWTALHRSVYAGHLRITILLSRYGQNFGDEIDSLGFKKYTEYTSSSSLLSSSSSSLHDHRITTSAEKKKITSIKKEDFTAQQLNSISLDKEGYTPLSLLSWKLSSTYNKRLYSHRTDIYSFGRNDIPM